MEISEALKLQDEIRIYKKLRDKNSYRLFSVGTIIKISTKFITVKLKNYNYTINIFDLKKGELRIMKGNKEVKFKPMEDEKQKAIDRGESVLAHKRHKPRKAAKEISEDVTDNGTKLIDEQAEYVVQENKQLKPKYYIASSLENADQVKLLACILNSWGWEHTYDWTCHGSVQGQGAEAIREVAEDEMKGVISADIVIMLMPGARGTHVELGMACAAGKKVIIYSSSDEYYFCNSRMCSFYMLPNVFTMTGSFTELIELLQVKVE